ncbi:MAG: hypothetical protein ACE5EK_00160 [Nitrospinales bacterium]
MRHSRKIVQRPKWHNRQLKAIEEIEKKLDLDGLVGRKERMTAKQAHLMLEFFVEKISIVKSRLKIIEAHEVRMDAMERRLKTVENQVEKWMG